MVLLFGECSLGNEHWEITVGDAILLEAGIQETLNLLPNEVSEGSQNVTSRDLVVFDQLTLGDDLLIPLGEVLLSGILNAELVSIFASTTLGLSFLSLLSGLLCFLLFSGSSSNFTDKLAKIDNLSLVVGELDYLLHVCVGDGSGGIVLHGMECNDF